MGLFKILKSVIGLGSSGSRSTSGTAEPGRDNVDVTVEHEPEPDTTSEDAVKGTGDETTADTASSPATEPDTAGETDDEAESEDATEPEVEADEAEPAAKTEDAGAEVDATEEADAEGTDESDTAEAEVENADASTDTIKGIGPSYAETLAEAGVETVGDLAAADAADVADGTDLSEKRVGRWIARARGEDE
jgi:predicted flap endonuclease-1-like 5' DNA nuclease